MPSEDMEYDGEDAVFEVYHPFLSLPFELFFRFLMFCLNNRALNLRELIRF